MTVVLVAHSLDEVTAADNVVVLEAGRVVEAGPPEDLLARGGTFRDLVAAGSASPPSRPSQPSIKETP